ncbi:cupin domain-containing protein [Polymorphobacter fuscus]|uniref:Cupin domain-containing protein n=1 Tax=Sandarakinorhabdus fusca TaxID=1439888 RepID=A0A7C9GPU1_9SPHN|nr:cupin domain-containing protein [Polymorphobacter fuscus]KAB7648450.1 cupin domain-containing protein [Polymorphobacter fuscus]MQT15971.1 cupin domain-containing protein [Polymorphobacter fuscus]NJC07752.1 putative cupin superfamily protein [Polymorphobacter fuscus]
MPKIDLDRLPALSQPGYLPPFQAAVAGRRWRAVGAAGGLTQFGANLVTLPPGAWSSQRHWHSAEDELIIVVAGTLVLVEDDGETTLVAGDIAALPAGVANGHHLQNRSAAPATLLAIGTDRPDSDSCHYPDIDMFWSGATGFIAKPT